MIPSSTAYKRTMLSPLRPRAYMNITLGLINQKAQDDCSVTSDLAPWSNGNIFISEQSNRVTYMTLEEKYNPSDGSYVFMPEVDQYKYNGICAPNVGDAIRVSFSQPYMIKGVSIKFGYDYPTEFTITNSDGEVFTYINDSEEFTCDTSFGETSYFIITPVHMKTGDNVRLRIITMTMGVGILFDNEVIASASIESYISPISESLSYTNFKFTAFDTTKQFDIDNDKSIMNYLEPMQPIKFMVGQDLDTGDREWIQIGSGYLDSWNAKSGQINISATDKMSQLQNEYSLGFRIYDRTAYAECESILQDAGYQLGEYNIDSYLKTITLHNPIPVCPHRNALQLVCNATRCIMYENANGQVEIRANFATTLDPEEIVIESSTETAWSNVDNILTGASVEYFDMSCKHNKLDGSQVLLPEDVSEYSDATGFVSTDIADENGEFEDNPYVSYTLPARFSYHAVHVLFGGTPPTRIKVTLYANDTELASYIETEVSASTSIIIDDYIRFDKVKLEILETEPGSRVTINRLTFGDASSYYIDKNMMLEDYYGFKEEKVRAVRVKIYTFELDGEGNPTEVKDDVYYTHQINATGIDKTCSNQLIHSQEQAELLATWLGNHYRSNVSYSLSFRSDPVLQAGDIVRLESAYKDNLQVEIEKNTLNFNGGFSGNLDLRKVLKLSDVEA